MSEKAKQEALTRAKEAEKRKKNIVCRGCGMKGHIQAKCRTNRVHLTQDDAGWVVMTTVLHEEKDEWVLDTGASISCVGQGDCDRVVEFLRGPSTRITTSGGVTQTWMITASADCCKLAM